MWEMIKRALRFISNLIFGSSKDRPAPAPQQKNIVPATTNLYNMSPFQNVDSDVDDVDDVDKDIADNPFPDPLPEKKDEVNLDDLYSKEFREEKDRLIKKIDDCFRTKYDGKKSLQCSGLHGTWKRIQREDGQRGYYGVSLNIPCDNQKKISKETAAHDLINNINNYFNDLKEYCQLKMVRGKQHKEEVEQEKSLEESRKQENAYREDLDERSGGTLSTLTQGR